MNGIKSHLGNRRLGATAFFSAALLWLSQPPVAAWPLAALALVPWLSLIGAQLPSRDTGSEGTEDSLRSPPYLWLWLAGAVYWLITLQGIRHAHPVMYLGWISLSAYLAVYVPLFVFVSRQLVLKGVPLWVAAPTAWVGGECLRNYLLTGISASMLGHSMADVPWMIQIADLFGSYGVSFVLVSINVALFALLRFSTRQQSIRTAASACVAAAAMLVGTLTYGAIQCGDPKGPPLATFALIQRNEPVEYEQDMDRAVEMFQNYADQSVQSLREAERPVDAVVWPESMFSGGAPWMTADPQATVPAWLEMSPSELQANVRQRSSLYLDRARYIQSTLAAVQGSATLPHLVVGCGVVHYSDLPQVFSGVVHVSSDSQVADWYGKTHLVMFGEYVPIVPHIPLIRSLVPRQMGLCVGSGAKQMMVGATAVVPSICIETAVERVTIDQIADLMDRGEAADVVVTVTNDGWFDDSSVITHHLRCAQLVAVGCRRPVLSAANNGPTAWIDSRGQLVQHLARGTTGAIIATPHRDGRATLYLRIGDWPARCLALLCLVVLAEATGKRWRTRRSLSSGSDSG